MFTSAIGDAFEKTCRDRMHDTAVRVLSDGRAIAFADLLSDCRAIAGALAKVGVSHSTLVVTHVGSRPVFFPLFVACMNLRAALIPLGDATDAELKALVADAGAPVVVTDREWTGPIVCEAALPGGVRVLRVAESRQGAAHGGSVVLKLTSGSTAVPKAAIASELHLINDGRHVMEAMDIGASDVTLSCLPLSHSYALGNVVLPLIWQGTSVALRGSFSPASFVSDAETSKATVFPGVPFIFEHLRTSGTADRLPNSLRLLVTAGATIERATVMWFKQHSGRKIHSFYGSSETGGIAYDDREEVGATLDVGRPMPETTVTIRRVDGHGRVFVAGNAVASRYWESEGRAEEADFVDGGFLTGDVGHLDGEGRLVLTGRTSRAVNIAGRKVDPSEVEGALVEMPGVADARAFGIACARRGQQLVAFVVSTDPELTPLHLRRLCAARLPPYKIPRRFVVLERLPIDARGKTDRRALEALVAVASE